MARTVFSKAAILHMLALANTAWGQTNETIQPSEALSNQTTFLPTSAPSNEMDESNNLPANSTTNTNTEAAVVLNEAFFQLTLTTLNLAIFLELGIEPDLTQFEYIKEYTSKADKSIVAKKDGKCFVAFRGSVGILDSVANFFPGYWPICPSGVNHCSCLARKGFFTGYDTDLRAQRDADIQTCVESCTDNSFETCLIVSGHSRGGSIAHVATVALQQYNPLTITSGHGRSLSRHHCNLNPTRMIRFVNSRHDDIHGMAYDRWPFFHQIDHLMWNHGITYILSDDITNLANIGVNGWSPGLLADDTAHALIRPPEDQGGYRNRIERIIDMGMYPVNTNGYGPGFHCTRDIECMSRKCTRVNAWFHHWVKKCE